MIFYKRFVLLQTCQRSLSLIANAFYRDTHTRAHFELFDTNVRRVANCKLQVAVANSCGTLGIGCVEEGKTSVSRNNMKRPQISWT